jgi:Fe-S-cluster-containing dehydrogenase component
MNNAAQLGLDLPVKVEDQLCSRFRCTKSTCSACAEVCPVPGAVRLIEQGVEISDGCVGCGACVSACPNGALQPRESDKELVEKVRRRVRPAEPFRMGCGRAEGHVDLLLPCLSRLTEALLLEPIRAGAKRVELLDPGCSACGLKKAAPQWGKVLWLSQALCESAGLGADRIARRSVAPGKPVEVRDASRRVNSRRALFCALSDKWQASDLRATLQDAKAAEAPPKTFRDIVQRSRENPKRSDLLRLLEAMPAAKATSKTIPARGIPLAMLEIDRRCVGCNVCETLCPTGALRHREEGGSYALDFDAALCTGCRVCEVACFYKAIRVQDTVDLALLFERPKLTLISARRQTCKLCGETFLGKPSESCPLCQLSDGRRTIVARRILFGAQTR